MCVGSRPTQHRREHPVHEQRDHLRAAVGGGAEAVAGEPVVGVDADDGQLVQRQVVGRVLDRLAQRVPDRERLDTRDPHAGIPSSRGGGPALDRGEIRGAEQSGPIQPLVRLAVGAEPVLERHVAAPQHPVGTHVPEQRLEGRPDLAPRVLEQVPKADRFSLWIY